MRIVSIGAVIGQAQVIPGGEKQCIVNHRIDLRTFDKIFKLFYPIIYSIYAAELKPGT